MISSTVWIILGLQVHLCSTSVNLQCYECSTFDATQNPDGSKVGDTQWISWITPFLTNRTGEPSCSKPLSSTAPKRFQVDTCPKGLCFTMHLRHLNHVNHSYTWRGCVPNINGFIRTDCTLLVNSNAELNLCFCNGKYCNGQDPRPKYPADVNSETDETEKQMQEDVGTWLRNLISERLSSEIPKAQKITLRCASGASRLMEGYFVFLTAIITFLYQ